MSSQAAEAVRVPDEMRSSERRRLDQRGRPLGRAVWQAERTLGFAPVSRFASGYRGVWRGVASTAAHHRTAPVGKVRETTPCTTNWQDAPDESDRSHTCVGPALSLVFIRRFPRESARKPTGLRTCTWMEGNATSRRIPMIDGGSADSVSSTSETTSQRFARAYTYAGH